MERIFKKCETQRRTDKYYCKVQSNKGLQLINSTFVVTVGDKIYEFQEGQDKVWGQSK